jgi:hypothetical protein
MVGLKAGWWVPGSGGIDRERGDEKREHSEDVRGAKNSICDPTAKAIMAVKFACPVVIT